jgi:Icc-related predicted phosphoesterase
MTNIEINIYSIVGNSICVDAEDGDKVFEAIKVNIEKGNLVTISFLNVEMLTSAFLNTAIGKLYGVFEEELLKKSLSTKDIAEDDKLLLKRVIDTAKLFYRDKPNMEEIVGDVLGDRE